MALTLASVYLFLCRREIRKVFGRGRLGHRQDDSVRRGSMVMGALRDPHPQVQQMRGKGENMVELQRLPEGRPPGKHRYLRLSRLWIELGGGCEVGSEDYENDYTESSL